jgi:hypothetical protein
MKKEKLKIFVGALLVVYVMIAGLCILTRQPFIFAYGYELPNYLSLFVLLGVLTFCLWLVIRALEIIYQKHLAIRLESARAVYFYFIFTSVFVLFLFSLVAGHVESGRYFFYYGCVTNSCIYLISGYTVTTLTSALYAHRYVNGDFKLGEKKTDRI